jgi:uncharacterized Zn-finger protein
MTEMIVPHFHNDPGVSVIEIGAREFMCVGATPLDHPHVYLDMGGDIRERLKKGEDVFGGLRDASQLLCHADSTTQRIIE